MEHIEELREELKKFTGLWEIVSYKRDGESWDVDGLEETVNEVGEFNVYKNNVLISSGYHSAFNLCARPREFTNVYLEDKDRAGNRTLAIYRFENDILETCHAPEEIGRPDEFVSNPGSGRSHVVLKRKAGDRN